jgi:uncharacterized OB-fold protein
MSSQTNMPEPTPKLGGRHSVARVWRIKAENYRLVGSECQSCGKKTFPRTPLVCPYCGSRSNKDVELSTSGTIVHGLFARPGVQGFEDQQPVMFATVRTDDGVYVEGEIINMSFDRRLTEFKKKSGYGYYELLAGKRVRAVVRRLRKTDCGYPVYGYKFMLDETIL